MFVSRAQIFYAFGINLGVCVPSGCSKNDVSEIVKYSKYVILFPNPLFITYY